MFSTFASVQEYTGKDISNIYLTADRQLKISLERGLAIDSIDWQLEAMSLVRRAQGIIEIYIGKDEIDIDNPSDLLVLDKMTAYQTAYMLDNEDSVFNQVAVTSQGQTDFIVNFNSNMMAPWIAPLAVIASKSLSFNKAKSIRTGKIFQFPRRIDWRKI